MVDEIVREITMHFEWLAMEHHRLHIIEEWSDGPHKDAALTAIRSSLASLTRNARPDLAPPVCEVCAGRRQAPEILEFPLDSSRSDTTRKDVAA